MLKKYVVFLFGIAVLFSGMVLPVMAQTSGTQDSELNIDINDFLTFTIANPAADCSAGPGGNCPFASGAGAADLTSTGNNAYEISGDGIGSVTAVFTQLQAQTNSNDGYNVTVYANDTGGRTTTMLRNGGTGGVATDEIVDSVQVLQTTDAANAVLDTTTHTGVALRVTDAGTSALLREADEDTQWGTTDDDEETDAAQARWASLPLGSAAARIVYDTGDYSDTPTTAYINWFVGAEVSQQTGTYTGTVTFTATVN